MIFGAYRVGKVHNMPPQYVVFPDHTHLVLDLVGISGENWIRFVLRFWNFGFFYNFLEVIQFLRFY